MAKEREERFDKFVKILRRVFGFEEEREVEEAETKRIRIGEEWGESDYYKSSGINYNLLVPRQLELSEAIRGVDNKIYDQARDISGIKIDLSWIKRILWVIIGLLISLFFLLI
jgi:hypothetical protein